MAHPVQSEIGLWIGGELKCIAQVRKRVDAKLETSTYIHVLHSNGLAVSFHASGIKHVKLGPEDSKHYLLGRGASAPRWDTGKRDDHAGLNLGFDWATMMNLPAPECRPELIFLPPADCEFLWFGVHALTEPLPHPTMDMSMGLVFPMYGIVAVMNFGSYGDAVESLNWNFDSPLFREPPLPHVTNLTGDIFATAICWPGRRDKTSGVSMGILANPVPTDLLHALSAIPARDRMSRKPARSYSSELGDAAWKESQKDDIPP